MGKVQQTSLHPNYWDTDTYHAERSRVEQPSYSDEEWRRGPDPKPIESVEEQIAAAERMYDELRQWLE